MQILSKKDTLISTRDFKGPGERGFLGGGGGGGGRGDEGKLFVRKQLKLYEV